eukprot:TRINITY_DN60468_c0_g1_i1.p1 TRINITY_DN60468_c0_g1~~TRINITY_DN60468_c0_g1_i1.p1  ORF type:complete len:280 (-),score=42.91 TRINITY_DN60468_c0_g1_i1:13-852(-)
MSALPIAKFAGILVRQVAKPVSLRLQSYAEGHPVLRDYCIFLGQSLHLFTARILRQSQGLMQYTVNQPKTPVWGEKPSAPAAVMRVLREDQALALLKAGRAVELLSNPDGDYQKVQWKERGGELKEGWIPKRGSAWYSGPTLQSSIKPLSSIEALNNGTAFISEAFIFSVGATWVVYEMRLSAAESKLKAKAQKEEMERRDREIAELKQRADEADMHRAELAESNRKLSDLTLALESLRSESQEAKAEREHLASSGRRTIWLAAFAILPSVVLPLVLMR